MRVVDYLVAWGLLGYLIIFPPAHTSSTFLIKPLESARFLKAPTTLFNDFTIALKKNLKLFSIIKQY